MKAVKAVLLGMLVGLGFAVLVLTLGPTAAAWVILIGSVLTIVVDARSYVRDRS